MTIVERRENSGECTSDVHFIYEKVSDKELKLTCTIDDQSAVYKYKKMWLIKTVELHELLSQQAAACKNFALLLYWVEVDGGRFGRTSDKRLIRLKGEMLWGDALSSWISPQFHVLWQAWCVRSFWEGLIILQAGLTEAGFKSEISVNFFFVLYIYRFSDYNFTNKQNSSAKISDFKVPH